MDKKWQIPCYEVTEIKPKQSKYCICIPVINEGERILKQLDQLMSFLGMADILLLDGGSTDGSTEIEKLRKLGVRALLIKTGPGKLSAQLRMGYAYALEQGYEGIITVDGNGKDNMDAIPSFVNELDNGWDMVQGSRYICGGQAINTPKIRHLAVKLIHIPIVSLVAGFKYTDTTNGFRAYSNRYLLDARVQPFRDVFDTYELLAYLSVRAPQLGFKTKEIPVTREYPRTGKVPTKIKFIKGNFDLIRILKDLILHKYDPAQERFKILQMFDSLKRNKIGIMLIIITAILASIGQLFWKLGQVETSNLFFIIIGFGFYGLGTVLMAIAFKYGSFSALHPLLASGYIFGLIWAKQFLGESISLIQGFGIALIMIAVVLIGGGDE